MFGSAVKRFIRNWANQTQLQATTTGVLIGTFTILFMALSVFQSISRGLESYGTHIQMTAYLSEDNKLSPQAGLTEILKSKDGIKAFAFVSAEEAIKNFKDKMSDHLPEMFFDKDFENPLPATLEIELTENMLAPGETSKIKALAAELKTVPGIEDVSFGFNWANQFSKVTRAFTMSGSFLILVLLIGGVFVIGNSVSQSIYQKRDEIEIMELFGATQRSIVIPFVVEGALTGLIAGVFALILNAIAVSWLGRVIADELGFVGLHGGLHSLGFGSSLLAVMTCISLGALSAYVFVSRITNGWAAATRSNA